MKTWDQFLRDVLPDVPGCPEPVAEHAIMRAAQEFCAGAMVWTVWLDNVTTRADATEYDIELEPASDLAQLMRATLDGRDIDITTAASLPSDWKTNTAGISTCLHTQDRKTMILLPAQAAGMILRVEAALKPADDAQGVEDHVFEYVETIAMGAKARLMKQADKPYTNPTLALVHESDFKLAINRVGLKAMRGFSGAMPRGRAKTF